ncbi:MAG: hypothetical protein ACQERC_01210 [Bacteroidota bacterium]
MKKLIYGGLFLAAVGIGIVSCKKEQNLSNERDSVVPITSEISVNNNLLEFNSISSFEEFIDNYDEEQKKEVLSKLEATGFKNVISAKSESVEDSGIPTMDEFLGQLLNEDGVIRIGDHLYQIDLQKEVVNVLPYKAEDEYVEALSSINSNSKKLKTYSTADDVLEIVSNGTQEKCGGIGGGDYVTSVVDFGNNIRCQGMVRHFRAGIYFRTTARFEPLVSGVIQTNMRVQSPQAWARKRPCNSGSVITSTANIKASGTTQQLWEFYSGTRNLNGLYLFVRVECTYNGQTLNSSWGGRNVNSPY